MHVIDTVCLKPVEILGLLHALGNDLDAKIVGHLSDAIDDDRLDLVAANPIDQRAIQLHEIGTQTRQPPKPGVPPAEIIESTLKPASR